MSRKKFYIPPDNSYNYKRFRRYIKQFTNFYNYGYMNDKGIKQFAYSREQITVQIRKENTWW